MSGLRLGDASRMIVVPLAALLFLIGAFPVASAQDPVGVIENVARETEFAPPCDPIGLFDEYSDGDPPMPPADYALSPPQTVYVFTPADRSGGYHTSWLAMCPFYPESSPVRIVW